MVADEIHYLPNIQGDLTYSARPHTRVATNLRIKILSVVASPKIVIALNLGKTVSAKHLLHVFVRCVHPLAASNVERVKLARISRYYPHSFRASVCAAVAQTPLKCWFHDL